MWLVHKRTSNPYFFYVNNISFNPTDFGTGKVPGIIKYFKVLYILI